MTVPEEKLSLRMGSSPVPIVEHAQAATGNFEMALQQESHLTEFNIPNDVLQNTMLYCMEVCPANFVSIPVGNAQPKPSRLAYMSRLFQQWTGDIKLRLYFTKAILAQVKLVFVYVPGMNTAQTEATPMSSLLNMQVRAIINPDNDVEAILNVPFISKMNWHDMNQSTGTISLWTMTPIVRAMDYAGGIPVHIFCSAQSGTSGLQFRYITDPANPSRNHRPRPPQIATWAEANTTQGREKQQSRSLFAGPAVPPLVQFSQIAYLDKKSVQLATPAVVAANMSLCGMRNFSTPHNAVVGYGTPCSSAYIPAILNRTPMYVFRGTAIEKLDTLFKNCAPCILVCGNEKSATLYLRLETQLSTSTFKNLSLEVTWEPISQKGQRAVLCYNTNWIGFSKFGQYYVYCDSREGSQIPPGILTGSEISLEEHVCYGILPQLQFQDTVWQNHLIDSLKKFIAQKDFSHIAVYLTGPIVDQTVLKAALCNGDRNAIPLIASMSPSFSSTQGARIFQGEYESAVDNKLIFKWLWKVFGGNPNSPWAYVFSALDTVVQFVVPLFLAYDGSPIPTPLTGGVTWEYMPDLEPASLKFLNTNVISYQALCLTPFEAELNVADDKTAQILSLTKSKRKRIGRQRRRRSSGSAGTAGSRTISTTDNESRSGY